MRVRRPAVFVLLLAVLAALAACGGSGGSSTSAGGGQASTAATTGPEALPTSSPDTGVALSRFVEAAGQGDAQAMWSLLTKAAQQHLGPTESDFARRFTETFKLGLGTFAGTGYKTVLAVETASDWGVAAIAGDRVRQGKQEFATYAATLRFEGGSWKLQLGDRVFLRKLEPKTQSTSATRPPVAIRIQASTPVQEAGVWLDGQPLGGKVSGTDPHDVVVSGVPAAALATGRHVLVVFGRAGELAAAGSTPLTITGPSA